MKQIDKLQREGEIEKILERFEKQFEADRNTCSDYLDVVKDFFRKELSSLIEEERKSIIKGLDKYKCDFNWDFKKNKPKHKSYIALGDVIKIINLEKK